MNNIIQKPFHTQGQQHQLQMKEIQHNHHQIVNGGAVVGPSVSLCVIIWETVILRNVRLKSKNAKTLNYNWSPVMV